MHNLSLKLKIQISFFTMLALIAIIGLVAYKSLSNIEEDLETIFTHRLPALDMLVQADRDLQQLLVAERSLLIGNLDQQTKDQFFKDFATNQKQAYERFGKYKTHSFSSEEQQYIGNFEIAYQQWDQESKKLMELIQQNNSEKLETARKSSLSQVSVLFEQMRDQLDKLQDLTNEQATKESEEAKSTYKLTVLILLGIIILGVLCALGLGYYLIQKISLPLTDLNQVVNVTNDVIKSSSAEVDEVSNKLSEGMSEQAASVEETSASLVELKEMVGSNLNSAKQANDQSSRMRDVATSGIKTMESVQTAMHDLKAGNEEIKALVAVIANIGEKTKIMDEIVFQTKLLSFNASVEAERAGEHGRGFAVVAQEVGNLASLSGKAALEIADIVGKSIAKAESITKANKERVDVGVNSVDSAIGVFKQVNDSAKIVSENAHQVLVASQEQLKGVEQINQAVIQIDQLTQTNAHLASLTADCSKALNDQVQKLEDVTRDIAVVVHGK